jgi:peptidoglycan-associated lipoprotein
MVPPRLAYVLVTTFLAMVSVGGCTRRPLSTQTVAPVPSTPVLDRTPGHLQVRPAVAPQSASELTVDPAVPSAARPSPHEFTIMNAVREIHFDFDRYDIRPGDALILDANAEWMRSHPEYLVLIAGHCDERGTNEYNLALGERRAKAAFDYLRTRGVASVQMTIVSYGEERPLCPEPGEHCWRQNRRAQFLVKPR